MQEFEEPVEVNEAHIGGLEEDMHWDKKRKMGRGTVGNSAVLRVKDHKTNQITANVIQDTTSPMVQEFVNDPGSLTATVYMDELISYERLTNHASVSHSRKHWTVSTTLRELAPSNGNESFWAVPKRVYHEMYYHLSTKHLNSDVTQFAGKKNLRDYDIIDQTAAIVKVVVGMRLKDEDLIL